jgi:glycosyltransferase involved in cell wall biosynthesis
VTDIHFVIPGDLDTLTGGYIYARRMIAELRAAGHRVSVHRLSDSFPLPTPDALAQAADTLEGLETGAMVVIDGLAFGAMPEIVHRASARLRLIALVHHALADETGLDPLTRDRLFRDERAALAAAHRVIVTSPVTARDLARYDVPAERIGVVLPGTDPAPLAIGSPGPERRLLCIATLTPRKGHAVLVRALAKVPELPWRLLCAGSETRDPETAATVRALIAELGLERRIDLVGEAVGERLDALYHGADLFVLASHLEGYGMALAEALARGLPIVSTTGGAIPETVPADAGLLVPPGDADAFAAALRRVFEEKGLWARLAAGARRAREALPTWPETARRFAAEIAGQPGSGLESR